MLWLSGGSYWRSGLEAHSLLMSNNRNHGGKREGAGRKPVDFNLVLSVGQACLEMEQQMLEDRRRSLLEDHTNLQDFFDDVNSIEVDERKAFIGSAYHKEHSKSVDDEAKAIGQPADVDGTPSRLIRITNPRGSITLIRKDVAKAFGISEGQVKSYLQKYRAFLRSLD